MQGQGGEVHTPLKYGNDGISSRVASNTDEFTQSIDSREILELRLRYKPMIGDDNSSVNSDSSLLLTRVIEQDEVIKDLTKASENLRFSAAVAGFAEIIRGSKYIGETSFDDIVSLARGSRGEDSLGYRSEFLQMVRLADELTQSTQGRISE